MENEIISNNILKGTVISFLNDGRAFGWIKGENNFDYYYHIMDVAEQQVLETGDKVNFVPCKSLKGNRLCAKYVLVEESKHKPGEIVCLRKNQPQFMDSIIVKG